MTLTGRLFILFCVSAGISLSFLSLQVSAKSTAGKSAKPNQIQSAPKKVPIQSKFNNAACSSYLDRMRSKMDNNWYLPDGTNHVTIKAVVGQNGSVDNVEISSGPKNETAEQAANEAFLKAQPLESLPSGSGDKVRLILDFESYADPHGDSRRTISSRIEEIKGSQQATPQSSSAADQDKKE